ncbi:MAG: site-specific integrase [Rubrivivax sp.]
MRRTGYASKSKLFAGPKPGSVERAAKEWLRENEATAALSRQGGRKTLAAVIEDFVLAPPRRGTRYWEPVHLDWWRAQLGGLKIAEISRKDINGAVSSLQRKRALRNTGAGTVIPTDTKISAATVNRYLASLSSVFNYALAAEIIDEHPMKGGKVQKLPEPEGRRRILDAGELQRLAEAADACEWPLMGMLLRLLLTTAARKSEVLGLRWHQLKLDESIALLGKTKNGRPRALPLVGDVREELAALKAEIESRPDALVFFDERDPTRPKNIDTLWRNVRAAAGLLNDREDPLDRVVLHSTRHTAVTKMLRGGANLAQAARVSGHQTLAMLARYEHLAAQDAVDLAQRLLADAGPKT